MSAGANLDKLSIGQLFAPPRMVGDSDVALLRQMAELLPDDAHIVEFGPWLGGVTRILAEYGAVSVVDRFEWSDLNAEAYPGLLEPGQSFRPLFEHFMQDAGVTVDVFEADFRDFRWNGGKIDFCYIDAPRRGQDLLTCLRSVSSHLAAGAYILVKNGLNPAYLEMLALIEVMAGAGMIQIELTGQPQWCNTVVLRPGPEIGVLSDFKLKADTFECAPVTRDLRDPWGRRFFTAIRLAQRLSEKGMTEALRLLREFPRETDILYAWDRVEGRLDDGDLDLVQRAVLAELIAAQVNGVSDRTQAGQSIALALRHWWAHTANFTWQAEAFDARLIEAAFESGCYKYPGYASSSIRGRSVLEIGRRLGLSGVGYIGSGAQAYHGIELVELTREMMYAENQVPPLAYTPIDGTVAERVWPVDLVLFRPEAEKHRGALRILEEIISIAQKPPEVLLLSQEGGPPRPFRGRQSLARG